MILDDLRQEQKKDLEQEEQIAGSSRASSRTWFQRWNRPPKSMTSPTPKNPKKIQAQRPCWWSRCSTYSSRCSSLCLRVEQFGGRPIAAVFFPAVAWIPGAKKGNPMYTGYKCQSAPLPPLLSMLLVRVRGRLGHSFSEEPSSAMERSLVPPAMLPQIHLQSGTPGRWEVVSMISWGRRDIFLFRLMFSGKTWKNMELLDIIGCCIVIRSVAESCFSHEMFDVPHHHQIGIQKAPRWGCSS